MKNSQIRQDVAELSRHLTAFEPIRCGARRTGLRRAAICIPLCVADGELSVAIIERAASLRSHAGQWGFPGGKIDAGETTLAAALREFEEELGVALQESHVLGRLDDFVTRSGYVISPFVVWIGDAANLSPNAAEVARVFSVSFNHLLSDAAVEWFVVTDSEKPSVRIAMHDDYFYAPSAAMLFQLREIALGRTTRVSEIEQPDFARR